MNNATAKKAAEEAFNDIQWTRPTGFGVYTDGVLCITGDDGHGVYFHTTKA
jgi:hypothetical protein